MERGMKQARFEINRGGGRTAMRRGAWERSEVEDEKESVVWGKGTQSRYGGRSPEGSSGARLETPWVGLRGGTGGGKPGASQILEKEEGDLGHQ